MALAASLRDGYIDEPILVVDPEVTVKFNDPPRADADMAVNSVYWAIGKQTYIASGPVRVQPIAGMGAATQRAIQWSFVLGLPALVLAVGVWVLVVRRL